MFAVGFCDIIQQVTYMTRHPKTQVDFRYLANQCNPYIQNKQRYSMTDFPESLEEKAEKIIKNFDLEDWDNSIPAIFKREIALTVDQIKRLQKFHKKQVSRLDNTECEIGTEMLQMEARTPKYSPYKYPEREKFQRQLLGVKSERAREDVFYEDRLQNFHRTLLGLIHKYEQIRNIDDKSRQDFTKTRTSNARTGRTLA
jgi:hypothetical protein